MTNPIPGEGPFFTLNPVPPPQPSAARNWGLPMALGLLAIPLLMFGFGFSQQQLPATTSPAVTPSVSPTPSLASQRDATTPQLEASATPPLAPSSVTTATPTAALSSDPATFPIARIHSPSMAVNFRAAPTLQSPILGVLLQGDLVELTSDRRVQQDGVTWVPVRWRGQSGWLASNFIGGSPNVQP